MRSAATCSIASTSAISWSPWIGFVAGIDFDQIVDQQHLDDPVYSDGAIGMFRQDEGIERNVPAVLCRVFKT